MEAPSPVLAEDAYDHAFIARWRHALHYRNRLNQLRRARTPENEAALDRLWGQIEQAQAWTAEAAPVCRQAGGLCADYAIFAQNVFKDRYPPNISRRWLAAGRRSLHDGEQGRHAALDGSEAALAVDSRDYVAAIDLAERALRVVMSHGDRRREAQELDTLGLALGALGDTDDAEYCHQRAYDLLEAEGDLGGQHLVALHLGEDALVEGDGYLARARFQAAVDLVGGPTPETLVGLAEAALLVEDLETASQEFALATSLAHREGRISVTLRSARGMALCHLARGNAHGAAMLLQDALDIARDGTWLDEQDELLSALALTHAHMGLDDSAQRLVEEQHALAEQRNVVVDRRRAIQTAAGVARAAGDDAQAVALLEAALQVASEISGAHVRFDPGRPEVVKDGVILQPGDLAARISPVRDRQGKVQVLLSLGDLLMAINRYAEAASRYQEAADEVQFRDSPQRAYALRKLADALAHSEAPDARALADARYREALEVSTRTGSPRWEMLTALKVAESRLQHDREGAFRELRRVFEIEAGLDLNAWESRGHAYVSPMAAFHLGQLLATEDRAAAAYWFGRALSYDYAPLEQQAKYNLAWALSDANASRARKLYAEVCESNDRRVCAMAACNLGLLLWETDPDEAARLFELAICSVHPEAAPKAARNAARLRALREGPASETADRSGPAGTAAIPAA